MNGTDLMGWSAAALTLMAFTMRDVRRLRLASLAASVCFIVYGATTAAWPVLALHAVLLPVNLYRLLELQRAGGAAWPWLGKGAGVFVAPLLVLLLLPGNSPAATPAPTYAERMHARALESFRTGRFPEAYGRFVELANLGHRASARYALWMCEQGLPLFGKDWDCSQQEIDDWAASVGVAPFRLEHVAQVQRRVVAKPVRR
jgi:hypothetical protein